jgi:hypothetical protein
LTCGRIAAMKWLAVYGSPRFTPPMFLSVCGSTTPMYGMSGPSM